MDQIEKELAEKRVRDTEMRAAAVREKIFAMSIGLSTSIISLALLYSDLANTPLLEVIENNGKTILAMTIAIAGGVYTIIVTGRPLGRFQEVDVRRREEAQKKTVLSPAAWPFPTSSRPPMFDLEDSVGSAPPPSPFYQHFQEITNALEERALNAEEKASILLDKGTTYTIAGIVFFIISIIVWQTISWIRGFQVEHIYGIISCTSVFIFVEFLSAWFLRQYRHFVDTATYLLKVKAIFDRYALVFLAIDSLPNISEKTREKGAATLLRMLEDPIKWPESYLLKKPEVMFANEAVNAINSLSKEMRKSLRKQTRKDTTETETK